MLTDAILGVTELLCLSFLRFFYVFLRFLCAFYASFFYVFLRSLPQTERMRSASLIAFMKLSG